MSLARFCINRRRPPGWAAVRMAKFTALHIPGGVLHLPPKAARVTRFFILLIFDGAHKIHLQIIKQHIIFDPMVNSFG
jgi:hypothetical protein